MRPGWPQIQSSDCFWSCVLELKACTIKSGWWWEFECPPGGWASGWLELSQILCIVSKIMWVHKCISLLCLGNTVTDHVRLLQSFCKAHWALVGMWCESPTRVSLCVKAAVIGEASLKRAERCQSVGIAVSCRSHFIPCPLSRVIGLDCPGACDLCSCQPSPLISCFYTEQYMKDCSLQFPLSFVWKQCLIL